MSETKERILNAAERLFAERGYDATSLRAITAEAGVNLAAVNYHFSSKETLLQALFTRRFAALNQQRLALLKTYESEAGRNPIPLEKLVRALLKPMFFIQVDRSASGKAFSRLLGRMYAWPPIRLSQILGIETQSLANHFAAALRHTLPSIGDEDLYWRVFFTIGATAHTLAASPMLQIISKGICDPTNVEAAFERLVTFVVSGLKEPTAPQHQKKGKKHTVHY